MRSIVKSGDAAYYAVYKIKETDINDSCIMRKINKDEMTPDNVPFVRNC